MSCCAGTTKRDASAQAAPVADSPDRRATISVKCKTDETFAIPILTLPRGGSRLVLEYVHGAVTFTVWIPVCHALILHWQWQITFC